MRSRRWRETLFLPLSGMLEAQRVLPGWPFPIEGKIPVDRPLGVPPPPNDKYVTWAS